MANTNIVRQIAYKYKLPIAQVKKILASYESYIEHSIINKKQVKIFNIGSLKIVDKKSRTITLPWKNKKVNAPAGKKIAFTLSKSYKDLQKKIK